jgi:hypothetical protein
VLGALALAFTSACSSSSGTGLVPVSGGAAPGITAGSSATSGGGGASATGGTGGVAQTGGTGGAIASGGAGGIAQAGASGSGGAGGSSPTCSPVCSDTMACVAGHCLPKPVALTSVTGCDSMSLALNGTTLYFTDGAHGAVRSIPVAGGPITDVATGQKEPLAVVVDDNGVYWSTTGTGATDNTIMIKTPSGAPAKITDVTLEGTLPFHSKLALDGKGNLLYGVGHVLMTVAAKANSTATALSTALDGLPTALIVTVSPARVFLTLEQDNAIQWRSTTAGSSGCVDTATAVNRPMGTTTGACAFQESQGQLLLDTLTLAGTQVLFANGGNMLGANSTVATDSLGTGTTIASTASDNDISGFANNATTVYFGEATGGIIEKALLANAGANPPAPMLLVQDSTGQPAPGSFVVDATNVYWRTFDATAKVCSVMKLPL